jgi:NAD(P)-dependent dehydrogenase (short-subunit alcohol dehydrogenase family)
MDMARMPQPETSVRKQFDLSEKTIIITGGAGFLGLHFAEAVAEMGGVPVLLDIDEESIVRGIDHLKSQHFQCDGFRIDLQDGNAIRSLVDEIVSTHKTIDVLINAAAFAMKNMREGGARFFDGFEEYDEKLWQVVLDINLTGSFLITQAVGKVMKQQKRGVVINIASDVAVISPDHRIYERDERFDYEGVPFNTPIAYPVSKAGILAFTRYLATYWAPFGIRVNSFSPAGVYRDHDPKFVEQLAFRIPMGRMAFPQEYKGPIVFLASDASSFMTGSNLIIDGGRTIW